MFCFCPESAWAPKVSKIGSGGQPVVQVLPEQLYKQQHKRMTSMLSQVGSELTGMDSLVVTLKKKKHDMGPVVLGQVEKLQTTFQELKTAIIEDLQNYPKDPKEKAKDLDLGLELTVQVASLEL